MNKQQIVCVFVGATHGPSRVDRKEQGTEVI